jgi:hypothetical protein
MRQREKARIWRRFMAGEGSVPLLTGGWVKSLFEFDAIIREGATGKFDPLPMKQSREYANAAGVKVGRMVGV